MKNSNINLKSILLTLSLAVGSTQCQYVHAHDSDGANTIPERLKFASLIAEAKKKGIGTKPYEDAIAPIDADLADSVKRANAMKTLQSLLKNLETQVRVAGNMQNFAGYNVVVTHQNRESWGSAAEYMTDVTLRIKRQWNPPNAAQTKNVSIFFKIQSQGTISDIRIESSSGDASVDAAALSAVRKAAPFRLLSSIPGYKEKTLEIAYQFEYNVRGKSHGGDYDKWLKPKPEPEKND